MHRVPSCVRSTECRQRSSTSGQSIRPTGSASSRGIAHRRLRRKCEEVIDVKRQLFWHTQKSEQLKLTRLPPLTHPLPHILHPRPHITRRIPALVRDRQRGDSQHRDRISSTQTIRGQTIRSAMQIVASAMQIVASAMLTRTPRKPRKLHQAAEHGNTRAQQAASPR